MCWSRKARATAVATKGVQSSRENCWLAAAVYTRSDPCWGQPFGMISRNGRSSFQKSARCRFGQGKHQERAQVQWKNQESLYAPGGRKR